MGGAASFLNPEPIADFTDVIAVGEGEILAYQLSMRSWKTKSEGRDLVALAQIGRGFYVPSLYDVIYNDDGTVFDYIPNQPGRSETRRAAPLRRPIRRKARCVGL